MLGRMDGAIDNQDLLSSGNRRIVNPAGAKDIEAGPEAGAGQKRKPRAARSAMQIQTQGRTEGANFTGARRKNRIDLRVAFKDFAKAVFHDDGEPKIGTARFQQMQRGGGENAIPKGAQPDNYNSIAGTKSFENVGSCGQEPLLVDGGFVDQHHRDIITDRIETVAGHATQTTAIGLQFDFGPAGGADEDLEQFGADGHVRKIVAKRPGRTEPRRSGAASLTIKRCAGRQMACDSFA